MGRDETVEGSLKCTPNSGNHRDLDFEISFKFDGKVRRHAKQLGSLPAPTLGGECRRGGDGGELR